MDIVISTDSLAVADQRMRWWHLPWFFSSGTRSPPSNQSTNRLLRLFVLFIIISFFLFFWLSFRLLDFLSVFFSFFLLLSFHAISFFLFIIDSNILRKTYNPSVIIKSTIINRYYRHKYLYFQILCRNIFFALLLSLLITINIIWESTSSNFAMMVQSIDRQYLQWEIESVLFFMHTSKRRILILMKFFWSSFQLIFPGWRGQARAQVPSSTSKTVLDNTSLMNIIDGQENQVLALNVPSKSNIHFSKKNCSETDRKLL